MSDSGDLDALRRAIDYESHPADSDAFEISALLDAIKTEEPGEQPHVLFYGLCLLAERAFPDREPSNEEILANPATPDLMRYLLSSLRRYRSKVKGPKTTSAERYRAIANALQMAGEQKNPGKWTNAFKERYCFAYCRARSESTEKGASVRDAHKAGVEAAYLIYREGEAGAQDSSDRQKAIRRIALFLEEEGYGSSTG